MAYSPDFRTYPASRSATAASAALDTGLRAYMLRVYNWMASGLLLTGIIAYLVANTSAIDTFYPVVPPVGYGWTISPLAMISMFLPLAFVLVLSLGVNRLSRQMAQTLYWLFCAAMGLSLTNIFLVYTSTSIVRVFFISAGTFAAMSLYGYTTKSDLTPLGQLPDDGADRRDPCQRREHVHA